MPTGIATSYDLTTGVKLDYDEAIWLVSPTDAPLLTGFGSDGLSLLPTEPVTETKFYWNDESILTPRSTAAAAVTTGDTVITVATGDRTKFSTGDVIRLVKAGAAAEVLQISGYGTTTDTILVTRALSGTATNYASGATIIGLGTALAEGSDPQTARTNDRNERYNLTQIFGPTQISMSRTETRVAKYGVASEWTHQTMNRIKENVISREQAYLLGQRYESTTTKIRTTGGLDYFIQTNTDATSTQLTVATINTNAQLGFNAGGVPEIVLCNPAATTDLNDLSNTSVVRVTNVDTMRGRRRVELVATEYGDVVMVRDRWMPKTHVFAYSREQVRRRVLDGLMLEALAKTGDSRKAQIVCEEGLEFKGEQHAFKMTNLSY